MNAILKMPRMGETMEEGTLTTWLVEPGQSFKRGDPLLEVETDKTVVEFPALGDGTLVKPLVDLGVVVDVGAPIAEIDVGDGPDWTDDGTGSEDTAAPTPEPDRQEAEAEPMADAESPNVVSLGNDAAPRRATPLARRLAERNGINIRMLPGSGRRGRIERRDVETAMASQASPVADGLQTGHGVAWLEKGAASGTPVLFIHGFAGDHATWAGLQAQMARSGCRTLAVDLPAHGASTAEALDTDGLHSAVQSVAQERLGWTPVHIVAHSMGAIAAVRMAAAHPTASLTLIAPAGLGRRINTGFLEAMAAPKSAAHVNATLRKLTAGPNGLSESATEAIFQVLSQGRLAGLAGSLTGASGQAVDIRRELEALARDLPVSVILGHRDQIVDWSEALEVSPLIATHHFPDVGHMPHWEAATEVQAVLERKIAS